MTTYYVDPVNGNDANDGLGWGTAWKTLLNGPTSARLGTADSDEIRIAKSPDPVSLGSVTWTVGSNTITVAGLSNITIDNCDSGWSAGLVTPTHSTATYRQGTASVQAVMSSTNGKVCYRTIASTDLSAHTRITFWVNFGTAVNYSTGAPIQIRLCSDTTGDTAVNTFTLPSYYYPANYWVPITIDNVSGMGAAIQSVSLFTTSAVSNTIRLDNITAAKADSDATSITLTDLVAKNDGAGMFYPITSIVGTAVAVNCYFASSATNADDAYTRYYDIGGNQTIGTVKRSTFATGALVPATATATAVNNLISTNASSSWLGVKTYIGGVNTSTDLVDGETWFDGGTSYGYGLNETGTNSNIEVSNIGVVRYYYGLFTRSASYCSYTNISLVHCFIGTEVSGAGALPQADTYRGMSYRYKWIYTPRNGERSIQFNPNASFAYVPMSKRVYIEATNIMHHAVAPQYNCIRLNNWSGKFVSTGSVVFRINPAFNTGTLFNSPNSGQTTLEVNNFITTSDANNCVLGAVGGGSLYEPATIKVTGLFGTVAGDGLGVGLASTDEQCPMGIIIDGVGPNARFGVRYMRGVRTPITVRNMQHQGTAANFRPEQSSAVNSQRSRVVFHNFNNVANDHRTYEAGGGASNIYWRYQNSVVNSGPYAWECFYGVASAYTFTLPLADIVCKAGKEVTITMRVRKSAANISAGFSMMPSNTSTAAQSIAITANNSWELVTMQFTPTENVVASVVAFSTAVDGTTGAIGSSYFDDLTVTQAD